MADLPSFKRASIYAVSCAVALFLVAGCLLFFQFWMFLMVPGGASRGLHYADIEPGMSSAAIAQSLYDKGIISDSRMFYLLGVYRKATHKLKAGEYAFVSPSTPGQILDQLVAGRVVMRRITLAEGSTMRDVARALQCKGMASEAEILQLAQDRQYISTLGLELGSLEGYLFPETYSFQKRQDAASILKAMVQQFLRNFPEEWEKRAEELGMGVHQIVTMASLVEKEAVIDSERPMIAAVFLNRLKKNMPLQSDPTAVYDLPNFSGPVTSAHLRRSSPYNTYSVKGLPPGPICNPGAKSLHAVLYPEKVPYIYFVSNNDGTHHFSETLREHREAVSRYREKRRGQQRMEGSAFHTDPSTHGIGILEYKEKAND